MAEPSRVDFDEELVVANLGDLLFKQNVCFVVLEFRHVSLVYHTFSVASGVLGGTSVSSLRFHTPLQAELLSSAVVCLSPPYFEGV